MTSENRWLRLRGWKGWGGRRQEGEASVKALWWAGLEAERVWARTVLEEKNQVRRQQILKIIEKGIFS